MLKWTVSKRNGLDPIQMTNIRELPTTTNTNGSASHRTRRSLGALPHSECVQNVSPKTPARTRNARRRQSLGLLTSTTRKASRSSDMDKENNNFAPSPPPFKLAEFALRDVSNITPTSTPTSGTISSQSRKRKIRQIDILQEHSLPSPQPPPPPQYASTLPSFDIEYSPFGMRPGKPPFPDSYYHQPRYFTPQVAFGTDDLADEVDSNQPPLSKKFKRTTGKPKSPSEPPQTPISHRLNALRFSKTSYQQRSQKRVSSRKSLANNHNSNSNTDNINRNNLVPQLNEDDSLTSSTAAIGDTTLDRMIDAILESARKESIRKTIRRFSCNFKLEPRSKLPDLKALGRIREPSCVQSPTYAAAEDPASDLQEEFLQLSATEEHNFGEQTMILVAENDQRGGFNEREVKTPDSVVKERQKKTVDVAAEECALKRQNALRRKAGKALKPIGLTLPNGIPSPGTPLEVKDIRQNNNTAYIEALAELDTPRVEPYEDKSSTISTNLFDDFNSGYASKGTAFRASSTPTRLSCNSLLSSSDGTRRCINFSPEFDENSMDNKRGSVASSTNSRYGKNLVVHGSLDLAAFIEDNKLVVHVIRCRDLQRQIGVTINAYVKVALLPMESGSLLIHGGASSLPNLVTSSEAGFQRTAVHRDSNRPFFDHRFIFELKDGDLLKRIQLAVWHRDRQLKRSDFLGCLCIPVKNVQKKEINGSFKLQNQACLTSNSQQPTPSATTTTTTTTMMTMMCESTQSSVDDNGGSGGGGAGGAGSEDQQTIAFSKKAIHQQDADENLFLRFLELDPIVEQQQAGTQVVAAPSSLQATPTAQRRQSSIKLNALQSPPPPPAPTMSPQLSQAATAALVAPIKHSNVLGRTPFTITKRLQRHPDKGYGFSIVWTHPPRVEKVETHLPAERAGILPGDFVIFVDKHNVVTMPEIDILNLIRSQGNALVLEIFRRPSSAAQAVTGQQRASNPILKAATATATSSSSTCSIQQQQTNSSNINISYTNNNNNNNNVEASGIMTINNNNNNISNNISKSGGGGGCNDENSNVRGSSDHQRWIPNGSSSDTANNNNNNNNSTNSNIANTTNNNNRVLQNASSLNLGARSSIACSNASLETTKRRLHLPQVTFSKESILPLSNEDQRLKFLYQLINREHHFVTALAFGANRFMQPLRERKDLISPNDHRALFQNIDELQRISEDILEQMVQDENEVINILFASRVYVSKTTAICVAYKKYCNGLKRADCVLVNKSRYSNSDFMKFITEPQVPRKRPDLTSFIHRPLQHFREILKLVQLTASHCRIETEEYKNFSNVVTQLQAAYREITVGGGLMEPLGEGRPLLTLQDLEARLVFTKCKPFVLASAGRQWVFGGDLSRVEGRSVKPYWTLLFSDILLFAKVSRDRVLFITEEPLPLINITDSSFNIRKKSAEFRITIDPNGRTAESPTAHCTPDLTRTPKRGSRRYTIILRAPSPELKAVWQNLLQRQIFLVNAALGQTPLSSPLESPDVMQLLLPISDIGATATSMASIKLSSVDSLPMTATAIAAPKTNQVNQNQQPAVVTTRHIEDIIDEKCRILNKNGTPKGGALHLAQWMKGQFDNQQQRHTNLVSQMATAANHSSTARATSTNTSESGTPSKSSLRQAAATTDTNATGKPHQQLQSEPTSNEAHDLESEEECIEEWSPEQVRKRSKELKLIDTNGTQSKFSDPDEDEAEQRSKSPSRSTTSDSQITVRSSPIITNTADTVSVCRQCHKHCKSHQKVHGASVRVNHSQSSSQSSSAAAQCCMTSSNNTDDQTTDDSSSTTTVSQSHCHHKKRHQLPKYEDLCQPDSSQVTSTNTELSSSQTSHQTHPDAMYLQLNGSCTTIASSVITSGTTTQSSTNTTATNHNNTKPCTKHPKAAAGYCQCKCSPHAFAGTAISPDEIRQETCKLLEHVHEIRKVHETSYVRAVKLPEPKFFCRCDEEPENTSSNNDNNNDNNCEWDRLIRSSPQRQSPHDPFEIVPSIEVVPPTPTESRLLHLSEFKQLQKSTSKDSPEDDSPQCDEPPYTVLNASGLKRFGTMSSLEKFPSDERNDSSDEEDAEGEEAEDDDDDDIRIVTKEVFGRATDEDEDPSLATRNWTSRAGSYVAEKMSFFEESRAFFDKYLGRWERPPGEDHPQQVLGSADEPPIVEDCCTSGATSGEDVWGTPTSGGENDEMQMFNSDQTHSSPTTSSSFTGDDDTELMMDELLMAPPMTASSVRGLLPRRRLEPLFEEDSESGDSDGEHAALRTSSNQGQQVSERSWASGRRLDSRGSLVPLPTTAISSPPRETLLEEAAAAAAAATAASAAATSQLNAVAQKVQATLASPPQPRPPPPIPPPRRTTIITTLPRFRASTTTPPHVLQTQTVAVAPRLTSATVVTSGRPVCDGPAASGKAADTCGDRSPTRDATAACVASIASVDVPSDAVATAGAAARLTVVEAVPLQPQPPVPTLVTPPEGTIPTTVAAASQRPRSEDAPSLAVGTDLREPSAVYATAGAVVAGAAAGSGAATATAATTTTIIMSPRLEMRLALNRDIVCDEDLINYASSSADLTSILGHDLCTYRPTTDHDSLSRSSHRCQQQQQQQPALQLQRVMIARDAASSWCSAQQKHSKMDTPTPNRKKSNPSTWSSFAFADQGDERNLSDLERLARQEMIYCTSQLKSGQLGTTATPRDQTMMMASSSRITTTMTSSAPSAPHRKPNKLISFLTRRNSENHLPKIFPKELSDDNLSVSSNSYASSSPATASSRDAEKALERRFWKQLSRRRRSNSASEISAEAAAAPN